MAMDKAHLNGLIGAIEQTVSQPKKGEKGTEQQLKKSSCLCIRNGIVIDDGIGVCCCRFVGASQ